MTLQQLIEYYGIQISTLEDIKKRVFIVGRFNTADQEPSAYLFSAKKRQDSRFKACRDLSYASFIDVIRPTLTEFYSEQETVPGEYLPYFTLTPQKMNSQKGDSSYIVDPFNYFFQRATSTAEHPHFTNKGSNKAPMNLLTDTPGETIYKQIRSSLKVYCSFQWRNYELIRAFAQLLKKSGNWGVPVGYSDGFELPVKFVPLFINYLYQEGTQPFDAELIGCDSQQIWKVAKNDPRFLSNFQKLVTAFKAYLLNPASRDNIDDIKLDELPRLVDSNLRDAFFSSREAFNILRQIIRSKVLLSMVLQWAIGHFHNLSSVKNVVGDINKNIAIENAIKNGSDGLMKPNAKLVEGLSVSELISDFKKHFRTILMYVDRYPLTVQEFESLPEILKRIGTGILQDSKKTAHVKYIMNEMEPEQKEATIKALESYIADVVIPRMLKEPGLTLAELKKKLDSYEFELIQALTLHEVADSNAMTSFFGKKDFKERDEIIMQAIEIGIGIIGQGEVIKKVRENAITNSNIKLLGVLSSANTGLGAVSTFLPPMEDNITAGYIPNLVNTNTEQKLIELGLDLSSTKDKVLLISSRASEVSSERLLNAPENNSDVEANDIDDTIRTLANVEKSTLLNSLKLYVTNENKVLAKTEIIDIVKNDVKSYYYSLSKIYKKYSDPDLLPEFKNKVEAMTLCQLLLINKNELHLEKAGTNLFDLLIDLVEKMNNPENPDLKQFFVDHSLTKYISFKHFGNNGVGFSALETVLKNQTEESLANVVQYVSELHGIKYMFDFLNGNDCEVVVINAHGDEYINWIKDNLDNGDNNLLNPAGLANSNAGNPQFPIVTCMTELAFNKFGWSSTLSQKRSFLESLSQFKSYNPGSNKILLPPICVSTSVFDKKNEWAMEGKSLQADSSNIICASIILGPSVPLNKADDLLFRTVLSSGYLFCTHLLSGYKEQLINLKNVSTGPLGRFRIIGNGSFGITNSMTNLISGSDPLDSNYSFASDFYLYIIGLTATAMKYSGKPSPAELLGKNQFWKEYYSNFFSFADFKAPHANSRIFDKVSIHKNMTDWSLKNDISLGLDLEGVCFFNDARNRNSFLEFTGVSWFNNLVQTFDINNALVIPS